MARGCARYSNQRGRRRPRVQLRSSWLVKAMDRPATSGSTSTVLDRTRNGRVPAPIPATSFNVGHLRATDMYIHMLVLGTNLVFLFSNHVIRHYIYLYI